MCFSVVVTSVKWQEAVVKESWKKSNLTEPNILLQQQTNKNNKYLKRQRESHNEQNREKFNKNNGWGTKQKTPSWKQYILREQSTTWRAAVTVTKLEPGVEIIPRQEIHRPREKPRKWTIRIKLTDFRNHTNQNSLKYIYFATIIKQFVGGSVILSSIFF